MCCKIMAVPELEKPRDQWCKHCDVGRGCKIYLERPEPCRTFYCTYLQDGAIGEHWKPAHSRMVLTSDASALYVYVDPARADAWRKEPYYSDLKQWSAGFAKKKIMTIVCLGQSLTAILPDRDKSLGTQGPDKALRMVVRQGARGPEYDVEAYDPGVVVPGPA